MDLTTIKFIFIFVGVATSSYQKCVKLKTKSCLGMSLSYDFTTTALANDSKDQNEIEKNLEKWKQLAFLPRCWEVLHPLLCRIYKPKCEAGRVQLPCRSSCLRTRAPCKVVEKFKEHGGWPDFLKCDEFPEEDCDNFTVRYV